MLAFACAATVISSLALGAMFLFGRSAAARPPLGLLVVGLRRLLAVAVMAAVALLAGVLAPTAAARSAPATVTLVTAPAVWPTPQQQTSRTDGFPLPATVGLVTGATSDPSAVGVVQRVLRLAGVSHIVGATDEQPALSAPVIVWVGGPSENKASAEALRALGIAGPFGLDAEGYVLGIGRGSDGQTRVVLAGTDTTGTFYAAQTLRQLVVVQNGRSWLPGVSVRDWPGTRLRGVIEGFYGPPWSTADRLSQLDFFASTKQNVYVYSAKDDRYLRAQWRQPYPAEQLSVIRQLVDRASADHVQFTYALSPGLSVCYSRDSDARALIDKLQSIWDIGVRSFAIALDDISYTRWNCSQDASTFGSGGAAAGQAQARLLNRVQHEFIDTHPGAHRLEMVPTEFYGVNDSPYKRALRQGLETRVIVEWTGVGVVPATIAPDQVEQAQRLFGHDILVWDNYPVNDYAPNRLFLGPYAGRDPGIADHILGITVNPMIESGPSKIAEFTSGAFLWNPTSYKAPAAWLAALHAVGGSAWQALRVFAENNCSSILNSAESPTLGPLMSAFWKAYESDANVPEAAAALSGYFSEMAAAPGLLHAGMDDDAFLAAVQPWLDKLGLYGRAGQAAVAVLVAQRTGDRMTAEKNRLALASLGDQLAATPQSVAPGVVDSFIIRAATASNPSLAIPAYPGTSASELLPRPRRSPRF